MYYKNFGALEIKMKQSAQTQQPSFISIVKAFHYVQGFIANYL